MTRYPYAKRRSSDFSPRWLMIGFAVGYLALVAILAVSILARLS